MTGWCFLVGGTIYHNYVQNMWEYWNGPSYHYSDMFLVGVWAYPFETYDISSVGIVKSYFQLNGTMKTVPNHQPDEDISF